MLLITLVLLLSSSIVHGFTSSSVVRQTTIRLHAEGGDVTSRRKRRKQRKPTAEDAPIAESSTPATASIPIQDIRELAGGSTTPVAAESDTTSFASTSRSASTTSRRDQDENSNEEDPLAQLLKDAENLKDDSISNAADDEPTGVKGTIRNALSTIVTVDFFVVCGLLLWFIAGIVSSVFFKDDAIQLGFNGIFESVVQPALGILMIASISDAVLKGKDEDAV